MNDEIIENRMRKMKKTSNREDMLLKTEKNLLGLRKNQIEKYIMSKRKVEGIDNSIYQISPQMLIIPEDYKIDIPLFLHIQNFNLKYLEFYLYSSEVQLMKYGLHILRKFVAVEGIEPHVQDLGKNRKLINYLASLLLYADLSVKFESSWVLINISNYCDQTIDILSSEKNINNILDFFNNADEHLLEHAIWLLGNLAADISLNREYLIRSGVLERLGHYLDEFGSSEGVKEKTIWVICNLCRGRVYEFSNYFIDIIPPLVKYLKNATVEKEVTQSLYIVFKLTSTKTLVLEKFINLNVFKRICEVMSSYDYSIKFYCVRIIANMVSGNDIQTQLMINAGVIELYRQLIEEEDVKILKEVLWGISNICAGTVSQMQRILEQGIMDKIFEICNKLVSQLWDDKIYYEALREALFAICNSINGGLINFRVQMLHNDKIDLLKLLTQSLNYFSNERRLLEIILISLKDLINLDEQDDDDMEGTDTNVNSVKRTLIFYGLEEILHGLLENMNESIQAQAESLYDILNSHRSY